MDPYRERERSGGTAGGGVLDSKGRGHGGAVGTALVLLLLRLLLSLLGLLGLFGRGGGGGGGRRRCRPAAIEERAGEEEPRNVPRHLLRPLRARSVRPHRPLGHLKQNVRISVRLVIPLLPLSARLQELSGTELKRALPQRGPIGAGSAVQQRGDGVGPRRGIEPGRAREEGTGQRQPEGDVAPPHRALFVFAAPFAGLIRRGVAIVIALHGAVHDGIQHRQRQGSERVLRLSGPLLPPRGDQYLEEESVHHGRGEDCILNDVRG
mmetsp:Transcript_25110/g.73574  ORF Transcript_25110/g.73574 Transcript_25110/m.73574 type:complete len:265 (-) Transcript_25110:1915-2709(-)